MSPETEHNSSGPQYPELTVVGIGASAGGLQALKRLLSELSSETHFAFVVVVHLSPDRESSLADLLQASTQLRVLQVTDTTLLEPNTVYVIPPNRNLSTIDSHLRLSELEERRRDRAPIDHFLTTLASTHGHRAMGIILTGTGSDGALGLARIKEAGGITLVQDPSEAEFSGMPQTAISMGMVDFVLPLEAIRDRLEQLARTNSKLSLADQQESLNTHDQNLLTQILAQVERCCHHDFSGYKVTTVARRIRRRMQLSNIVTLADYLLRIRADETETRELYDDLLITVTSFFRDPETFEALREKVIPLLFENKEKTDSVRVWVNGCATGEEAYTIAMLLLEYADTLPSAAPDIQIFASDLHQKALDRAREGFYTEAIQHEISPLRLDAFFEKSKGGFRVKKRVRERVIFAPHNLLSDPPFSRLDLVSCRNVMIYFKRKVQRDVINLFHYALNPGGFLLLGTSESVETDGNFNAFDKRYSLFRKSFAHSPSKLPALSFSSGRQKRHMDHADQRQRPAYSFAELHKEMLDRFEQPSILLNCAHDIVHISHGAGRYLNQPGGEPTNNIFKLVVEPLRIELRAALLASQTEGSCERTKPVRITIEGAPRHVSLNVRSPKESAFEGYHLVTFIDEPADAAALPSAQTDAREISIAQLENELDLTKKRMQAVIEEYETSQEEMRAANEEMLSTNEELRSTMEELETSKEELQSMNEELATVNQENRHKVEELSELTGDLQNLLTATDIATLFLDRQFRILRFTPKVADLINVRQTDRGRPLTDFTHRLGYADLVNDAAKVLANLQPIDREILAETGQWHLLRIIPYRSIDDRIEGVVVTLVDISALKKSNQDLEALTRELESRVAKATAQARKLASKLALAEQMERSRIAQILHDDLQQILYSAQMRLQFICDDHKVPASASKDVFDAVRRALNLARDLSIDLSPPVLNSEGLKAALSWLRNQTQRLHGIDVALDVSNDLLIDDKDLRMLIFQIARELLFNVAKHAQAKNATIAVQSRTGDFIRLIVEDDGCGFDPSKLEKSSDRRSGFGLGSISERLELMGGNCSLESQPGRGTRVTVEAPYRRTPDPTA